MKSKAIKLSVIFMIILIACNSGQGNNTSEESALVDEKDNTEISFNEYEYDFGKIIEGEKVAHIFAFENKGPGRLVVSSASTSCGCTVTKYDKNPIPPGKGGSLEVVFNSAGRSGAQTKTVTVRSNAKTRVVVLKITAEVIPDDR
jgi:hypothetical protein